MRAVFISLIAMLAAGCGSANRIPAPEVRFGDSATAVVVSGLDECDDQASKRLEIDPDRPLVVIVHGCNASGRRFRALARVFEEHDQQTVCFNYDDRESIIETSASLTTALEAVEGHMRLQPITVLGHSQGGLVSRRALAEHVGDEGDRPGERYRLVTVSSPFDGIEASSRCSSVGMHVVTLGVSALLCRIIAGDKWDEIHPEAEFMREPGILLAGVDEHLEVITDERDSCRRFDDSGECVEDDYVFSVAEQTNDAVQGDSRVSSVEVKAGHVEIVGNEGQPPDKLIALLQAEGVLAPTPEDRREEIAALIRALF
jgi:hypothetical protein